MSYCKTGLSGEDGSIDSLDMGVGWVGGRVEGSSSSSSSSSYHLVSQIELGTIVGLVSQLPQSHIIIRRVTVFVWVGGWVG